MSNRFSAPSMIVVYEKRPRWTPELERRLADELTRIRGCHDIADVLSLVAAPGVSVLVLSLEDAEGECLQILGRLSSRRIAVPTIALGSRNSKGLEWPFRELGACDFLTDGSTAADVARICRRRLEHAPHLSLATG